AGRAPSFPPRPARRPPPAAGSSPRGRGAALREGRAGVASAAVPCPPGSPQRPCPCPAPRSRRG
ncbi:unnamed protein product, partial [Coccothraustes coccothraustes]